MQKVFRSQRDIKKNRMPGRLLHQSSYHPREIYYVEDSSRGAPSSARLHNAVCYFVIYRAIKSLLLSLSSGYRCIHVCAQKGNKQIS